MNLTTQVGVVNLALARLGEKCDLTSITDGPAKVDNLIPATYDLEREFLMNKFHWDFAQKRVELDFTVTTISGATQADPVVITVSDITDFPNGCIAEITHVDGMTELNNEKFYLDNRNTSANTTELYNDEYEEQDDVSGSETINSHATIDGTNYSAYASDGQLRLIPYGYGYAYDLPSDCIDVSGLVNPGGGMLTNPYEVVRDKLYTDLANAFLEYTYQITDDTSPIFHGSFIDCLAWRLAMVWGFAITKKREVYKVMKQEYEESLTAAETKDARQSPRDYSYTDDFIRCRG